MEHNEFILKVLRDAANRSLPEQMGPQYTIEELEICNELIHEDLLDGDTVEDEKGRTCTILHPKITLKGRELLRQQSEDTFIKKHGVRLLLWLLGVVGILIIAWLTKTWGLN